VQFVLQNEDPNNNPRGNVFAETRVQRVRPSGHGLGSDAYAVGGFTDPDIDHRTFDRVRVREKTYRSGIVRFDRKFRPLPLPRDRRERKRSAKKEY